MTIGIIEENAIIDRKWADAEENFFECTCVECDPKTRHKCPSAWELGDLHDVCMKTGEKLKVRHLSYLRKPYRVDCEAIVSAKKMFTFSMSLNPSIRGHLSDNVACLTTSTDQPTG